jgi:hypothetical protein
MFYCRQCGRPRADRVGTSRIRKFDKYHTLCHRCWRDLMNHLRTQRKKLNDKTL